MDSRIHVLLVISCVATVLSLPPPHPAVVAARHAEELLPPHLRKPALHNPHLQEALQLTSLLHNGEMPVFEREADNVPRRQIYNILTHAGFIRRQQLTDQGHFKHADAPHHYPRSHDSPFSYNPELLQYL